MNPKMAIALVGYCSLAGALSCSKERAPKQEPASGAAAEAPRKAPEIPLEVMPKIVKATPPVYPEEARARGEEGAVFVRALIGRDGHVTEAAVDPTRTASAVLAKAAVDAVKEWTFEPVRSKGESVEVWIVVPVNFKLRDSAP